MIGYRDRAWCCSKACKNKCGRKVTEEVMAAAVKWWGGPKPPFNFMEFCDEKGEVRQ